MQTFIQEVLSQLANNEKSLSQAIFVLPSKRAVGFLRRELVKQASKPYFSPKIISIEEFIEEISGLKIIDSLSLLFKSYDVYLNSGGFKEKDSFEEFTSWWSSILNDFNEIDRYLVPKSKFFNYLLSIRTMEKWGVKNEQTSFVKNYLSFWESLEEFYENLNDHLYHEQKGYQGMVYRKAAEDIEHYISNKGNVNHYFLGFNALNTAEQTIFQELLETGNTSVFWDMNTDLLNDNEHSASLFLRYYKKNWNYYKNNPVSIINSANKNDITIVKAENDIGQSKYVGQLLATYPPEILNNTAVVLADETLLTPLLYAIPETIEDINVTMGVSINNQPVTNFFNHIFDLLINKEPYYYKNIEALFLNVLGKKIITNHNFILDYIKINNISSISFDKLLKIGDAKNEEIFSLLFNKDSNTIPQIINNLTTISEKLLTSVSLSLIEKSILLKIEEILGAINSLIEEHNFIETPSALKNIFNQYVSKASIDFEGNPEKGLQIMGVLETRVIDFKNIIVLSTNEGILPSGKSNASFITFDTKLQFNLPLHPEKDAIYAYHFFHLLFRSNSCTFIYTSQAKSLNAGEKSRFLLQLEVDPEKRDNITYQYPTSIIGTNNNQLKHIEKDAELISEIEKVAAKGFSPSALISYIRNPIDFYYERVLKINTNNSLEETLEYNTLGTIVHEALENLYTPFINSYLKIENLTETVKQVEKQVKIQFHKHFKEGDFSKGKNLIIFEISKKYAEKLIKMDIEAIKAGNTIKILALESPLKTELNLSEKKDPVILKGNVDRIDLFNDELRIIDYKTGKVEQRELDIIDWEEITKDYKYSKAFQVLTYAYLYQKCHPFNEVKAGIISFKNLNSGFMSFRKKEAPRSTKGNDKVNSEILTQFEIELKKLILEIMDPVTPIVEKEIEK